MSETTVKIKFWRLGIEKVLIPRRYLRLFITLSSPIILDQIILPTGFFMHSHRKLPDGVFPYPGNDTNGPHAKIVDDGYRSDMSAGP